MSIDLEAIKACAEAATPGPWWHERLTGEPTEDEVDRVADVLAAHGYRVTWDWYPLCTCGWRADQPRDVASYDRHVARAALRAARGLS